MLKGSLLIVLALVGLFSCSSPSGTSITLVLKPKVGAIYVYEKTTVQTTTPPGGAPASRTQSMQSTMEVIESDSTHVLYKTTVESADNPQLKGVVMNITMSPGGQVQSVTSPSSDPALKAMLTNAGEGLKMTPPFPSKALAIGDKWTSDLNLAEMFDKLSQGNLKVTKGDRLTLNLSLARIDNKDGAQVAVVAFSGSNKVELLANRKALKMDWKLEGETDYDTATGSIFGARSNQHQEMDSPAGKVIVEIKTTQTLKSSR